MSGRHVPFLVLELLSKPSYRPSRTRLGLGTRAVPLLVQAAPETVTCLPSVSATLLVSPTVPPPRAGTIANTVGAAGLRPFPLRHKRRLGVPLSDVPVTA